MTNAKRGAKMIKCYNCVIFQICNNFSLGSEYDCGNRYNHIRHRPADICGICRFADLRRRTAQYQSFVHSFADRGRKSRLSHHHHLRQSGNCVAGKPSDISQRVFPSAGACHCLVADLRQQDVKVPHSDLCNSFHFHAPLRMDSGDISHILQNRRF